MRFFMGFRGCNQNLVVSLPVTNDRIEAVARLSTVMLLRRKLP